MWNLFPVSLLSYISSGIENNILETMIVSTFLALKHGACRTSIDNFLCFRSWTLAILLHLFLLKDTDIYNINYAADLPITAVGFGLIHITVQQQKSTSYFLYISRSYSLPADSNTGLVVTGISEEKSSGSERMTFYGIYRIRIM